MSIAVKPMDERDKNAVERLLGRKPKVPFTVLSRCPAGTFQVLQAYPVFWEDNRWKPFPTFLWLVCPRLKKEISRMEQGGMIREVTARLESDAAFRDAFIAGQEKIRASRMASAELVCVGRIPEQALKILRETGISGSRNPFGVKCLHAHVAQTLGFGHNPIGEMVLERVGRCRKDVACDPKSGNVMENPRADTPSATLRGEKGAER